MKLNYYYDYDGYDVYDALLANMVNRLEQHSLYVHICGRLSIWASYVSYTSDSFAAKKQ
jgi:hypothetical protein